MSKLTDMNKRILMHADIEEGTKARHVGHHDGENQAGNEQWGWL